MRLPNNRLLSALALLALCASAPPPAPPTDYPVVLGDPFTVDGKTYTPVDTMNYDAVGQAVIGADGGSSISVAHRTLPLPSYVEVTSLESGRTILARAERRGPMTGSALVELSPGAAAQLGVTGRTAVRVRRVNPPEPERSALRSGQAAALRLDTPKGLLAALKRKLAVQEGAPPPAPLPLPAIYAKPASAVAAAAPAVAATKPVPPTVAVKPAPPIKPRPTDSAASGHFVVQVGAYSNEVRAKAAAAKVGGSVAAAGKLFRVRVGPFNDAAQAATALTKAKSAGFGDARVQRLN